MTLDDWKTMTPEEEQDGDFKCDFCERDIQKSGFCSRECEVAYYND